MQIQTKYIIKNTTDITSGMFDNATQISEEFCRKSIDGTKIILKFEGETPVVFSSDSIYTHAEILQELKKAEWIVLT